MVGLVSVDMRGTLRQPLRFERQRGLGDRRVDLHLLRTVGADTLAAPFDTLPGMKEVSRPIIDGMRGVVTLPWGTAGALRSEFAQAGFDWVAKTGTLKERDWTGSLFLFVGAAQGGTNACATAGVVTIEFTGRGDPDGKATAMFRSAIAPLLRQELGWGDKKCVAR